MKKPVGQKERAESGRFRAFGDGELLHDGTLARDVKAIASSLEHDKAHGARENERQAGDHVQDAVLHVEHQ